MTYQHLQSLLPNDEIHYNNDHSSQFILYENTIEDYTTTINTLKHYNIDYTIVTDELNLDTILI